MTFAGRTTLAAGAALLAASFAQPGAAQAQSFLDKVDGKTVSDLRGEVRKRFKTLQDNSSDSQPIKLDRSGLRRLLDRYMPAR